jgi:hypothetical protein
MQAPGGCAGYRLALAATVGLTTITYLAASAGAVDHRVSLNAFPHAAPNGGRQAETRGNVTPP